MVSRPISNANPQSQINHQYYGLCDRLHQTVDPSSGTGYADWTLLEIPLDAYAGQTIRVRLRAVQGSAYTSDVWLIDALHINTSPVNENLCKLGLDVSDSASYGLTINSCYTIHIMPQPEKAKHVYPLQLPDLDEVARRIRQVSDPTQIDYCFWIPCSWGNWC